ncbi:MAG: hypothetical protein M0P37_09860 [Synergistaceae bacterium]|jgi:hypothetical protein|nr:hypothetical protein [Synergistaceae bacterium]
MKLPELEGTEKQVEQAEIIRAKVAEIMPTLEDMAKHTRSLDCNENPFSEMVIQGYAELYETTFSETSAKVWIDEQSEREGKAYYHRAVNTPRDEKSKN